jgi:aspartyl-tRNA(Asn)/glutamyl-tRNA(Gln) amidotransferase subunit B
MRFDVNVSVSRTDKLGTRSETKNLNSFRSVEKAVEYEIKRQIELLEKGGKIVQETRGWDDAKQKSFSQRSKENADDYRYMPDPDIPPVVIEKAYIAKIKKEMPDLPDDYRKKFKALEIDDQVAEDVLDNDAIVPRIKEALERTDPDNARHVLFQLIDYGKALAMSLEDQIAIAEMVKKNLISSTAAKAILEEKLKPDVIKTDETPQQIAERLNLLQVSDEGEIAKIVEQVIKDNPQAAEDVKNGEMKAIGFLVGQVMKASKGKANPALTQKLIKKQLVE